MEAFARYLGEYGFRVTVLSLSEGEASGPEPTAFGCVYRETNRGGMQRARFYVGEARWKHWAKAGWNTLVNWLNPLPEAAWMRAATQRLELVHAQDPIALVISSFSPVEAHIAATRFLKRHPEIRWIADMRDEMSMNTQVPLSTRKRLARAERDIAMRATAITSVSAPILNQFRRLMPEVPHFAEIRNGFNHEVPYKEGFNPVFQMVYAGIFYGLRKPGTFFAGLQLALREKSFAFEMVFVGTHHNFQIPPDILPHCRFVPRVSNTEAVAIMAAADANVLILPEVETKGVFSGKIFDQISVCKPVLAVVDPHDVAAALVEEMQAGYVADFNDPQAIASAILKTYGHWERREPLQPNREAIAGLHRKHQVALLAQCIETVLKP